MTTDIMHTITGAVMEMLADRRSVMEMLADQALDEAIAEGKVVCPPSSEFTCDQTDEEKLAILRAFGTAIRALERSDVPCQIPECDGHVLPPFELGFMPTVESAVKIHVLVHEFDWYRETPDGSWCAWAPMGKCDRCGHQHVANCKYEPPDAGYAAAERGIRIVLKPYRDFNQQWGNNGE